jgi:hypothetical protein
MKTIILTCILLLLSTGVNAEERILVFGAGLESCGEWLDLKTDSGRLERKQWIYGYLTGRNWGTRNKQTGYTDPKAMGAFLDMYCRNNPLHVLFQAANALQEEAGGPKAQHEWKK